MDPLEKAVQLLVSAPDPVTLVFVGPACRTWFVDVERLRTLIADLYEIRPFVVLHGGKLPFDGYVEQICQRFGIPCDLVGPPNLEDRLTKAYSRDYCLGLDATMVVAFPEEPADWEKRKSVAHVVETADDGVVRNAVAYGVPVLAIYRGGICTWRR